MGASRLRLGSFGFASWHGAGSSAKTFDASRYRRSSDRRCGRFALGRGVDEGAFPEEQGMADLISFGEIEGITSRESRTLLTGNGFSRARFDAEFDYQMLRDVAVKHVPSVAWELFEELQTSNFEEVLGLLSRSAKVAAILAKRRLVSESLAVEFGDRVLDQARLLREGFIRAMAATHPETVEPGDGSFAAAAAFLRRFRYLFTLNYDLMTYWALAEHAKVTKDWALFPDGFRGSELRWATLDDLWELKIRTPVLYLHGALHLAEELKESGLVCSKLSSKWGKKLTDQVKTRLAGGRAPLFVLEGTSPAKVARIDSSEYLRYAFRQFRHLVTPNLVTLESRSANRMNISGRRCERTLGSSASSLVYSRPTRLERPLSKHGRSLFKHDGRTNRSSVLISRSSTLGRPRLGTLRQSPQAQTAPPPTRQCDGEVLSGGASSFVPMACHSLWLTACPTPHSP